VFPKTKKVSILLVGLTALGVSACGGGGPAAFEGERGIFTSTTDCVNSNKFKFEVCNEAISKAIKDHRENAKTYGSIEECNHNEGKGRCERSVGNTYRPKLLAFLVGLHEKDGPSGQPLYAPPKDEKGFRDARGMMFLKTDFSITFSEAAVASFEAHAKKKKRLF